jgi:hypothetical protein
MQVFSRYQNIGKRRRPLGIVVIPKVTAVAGGAGQR